MNIKIRKQYKDILKQIHDLTQDIDLTQSDNLLKIIDHTKINNLFNVIDYWDKFTPNALKPYSILNTDKESDTGNGTHWVGVFQEGNVLFLYDSFARKRIMKSFCDYMKKQGFKCVYVNKKTDQQSYMINCGIRSLLWLLFCQRYGIKEASKI